MKTRFGPYLQPLYNEKSPSIDIIYQIKYLLYNESRSDSWKINSYINVGNYDKFVSKYNQDKLTQNV